MIRTIKTAAVNYLAKGCGNEIKSAVVVANNDEEVQRAVNKIEGKRNSTFILNIEYTTRKFEIDDKAFFANAKEITE